MSDDAFAGPIRSESNEVRGNLEPIRELDDRLTAPPVVEEYPPMTRKQKMDEEGNTLDESSELAESEGITFRYEILIANTKRRLIGGIFILIVMTLACFAVGAIFMHADASKYEMETVGVVLQFLPSLLVLLLFAVVSVGRYVLNLSVTIVEARVALDQQYRAQSVVRSEFGFGGYL